MGVRHRFILIGALCLGVSLFAVAETAPEPWDPSGTTEVVSGTELFNRGLLRNVPYLYARFPFPPTGTEWEGGYDARATDSELDLARRAMALFLQPAWVPEDLAPFASKDSDRHVIRIAYKCRNPGSEGWRYWLATMRVDANPDQGDPRVRSLEVYVGGVEPCTESWDRLHQVASGYFVLLEPERASRYHQLIKQPGQDNAPSTESEKLDGELRLEGVLGFERGRGQDVTPEEAQRILDEHPRTRQMNFRDPTIDRPSRRTAGGMGADFAVRGGLITLRQDGKTWDTHAFSLYVAFISGATLSE